MGLCDFALFIFDVAFRPCQLPPYYPVQICYFTPAEIQLSCMYAGVSFSSETAYLYMISI
jgi:hypothetical protein